MNGRIQPASPRAAALVTLAALIVMIGIRVSQPSLPGNGAPGLPMQIGITAHPVSALALIAADRGLFAVAGLDADLRRVGDADAVMTDILFTGQAPVVISDATAVAHSGLFRDDFRVLAGITGVGEAGHVVARGSGNLRAPGDLRGRRVGVRRASAADHYLESVLVRAGLRADAVDSVDMPVSRMVDALASGEVDAIAAPEPVAAAALGALGLSAVSFRGAGNDPALGIVVAADWFVAESPVALERLLWALQGAAEFALREPAAARAIVARELRIPQAAAGIVPRLILDPSVLAGLAREARWLVQAGHPTGNASTPRFRRLVHAGAFEAVKPGQARVGH